MPMADLLSKIDSEIRAGLKNEAARLDDALFNFEFYRGDFSRFPPRRPGGQYDSHRYPRTSPIMRRVVQTLTNNLYAEGPQRSLKPPDGGDEVAYKAASDWLTAIYRVNAMDAFWQEGDRMAAVGDFCGFQVKGTRDPKRPVRVLLWRANELVVWLDPDDQLMPIAVATLDMVDNQRRLTLWTATDYQVYVTDKWNPGQPNGATAYKPLGPPVLHPYGVIPFSFAHFEFPTCYFYNDGPGTNLRHLNDGLNFAHTEGFDCVRFNLRPVIVMKNVRAGYRPPSPVQPGDIWDLPAAGDGMEGDPKQEAEYLQADSSFVAAGWDDAQSFLDHNLSMHGVPPATVRLTQDAARSGVSIVAEQIPLILWAKSRQRPYACYEDNLAKLVLIVGAKHLEAQDFDEYRATASQLAVVADEPGLTLRWPSMYPKLPGEETDRSDQFRLDNKFRSRTQLLMERENLTREEAIQQLEETAEDLKREQELFGDLTPPALQQGNGNPTAAAEAEPTDNEPATPETETKPATDDENASQFDY
jgi:hypothetical protein